MALIDLRLATNALIGLQRRARIEGVVIETDGGFAQRVQLWQKSLRSWTVEFIRQDDSSLSLADQVAYFEAFFAAVGGVGNTFRLRDPADYTAARQQFATGTGAEDTYQLTQNWDFGGGITASRDVTLPVAGFSLWIDNTLRTITTDYTVDLETGIVTTTAGLGDITGLSMEWAGQFDHRAGFTEPEFDVVSQGGGDVWRLAGWPIREDRP